MSQLTAAADKVLNKISIAPSLTSGEPAMSVPVSRSPRWRRFGSAATVIMTGLGVGSVSQAPLVACVALWVILFSLLFAGSMLAIFRMYWSLSRQSRLESIAWYKESEELLEQSSRQGMAWLDSMAWSRESEALFEWSTTLCIATSINLVLAFPLAIPRPPGLWAITATAAFWTAAALFISSLSLWGLIDREDCRFAEWTAEQYTVIERDQWAKLYKRYMGSRRT